MLHCAAQGNMADHVCDVKLWHMAVQQTIPYIATLWKRDS